MIARTINSPGIEINEIDRSQIDDLNPDLQTAVVFGFADRGDAYVPHRINTLNDFRQFYGIPANEAERYMYNAAKEIVASNGTMIAVKLPYDNIASNSYTYTTYKVSDNEMTFKSPFEIIYELRQSSKDYDPCPAFDEIALKDFYILSGAQPEDLSSAYFTLSAKILQMARDFISNDFAFDNSFEFPLDRLFGYAPVFYNLEALLKYDDDGSYSSDTETMPIGDEYLKGSDLYEVLKKYIPDSTGDLPNPHKFRESYLKFTHAFKHLVGEGLPDSQTINISGDFIYFDTQLGVTHEELIAMKKIFNDAGIFTLPQFLSAFFMTFSLKDVVDTYYDLSSFIPEFNFIGEMFVNESDVSADFLLPYTGVRQKFDFAGRYRTIESLDRSYKSVAGRQYATGTLTIEAFDSLVVGESKAAENTIQIVDLTRGRYGHDTALRSRVDMKKENTDQYIGIMPVIITPVNAMYFQNMVDWNDRFEPYNVISAIQPVHSKLEDESDPDKKQNIPLDNLQDNLAVPLASEDPNVITLGTIAAKYFPQFSYENERSLNKTNFNKIGIVVFKMYADPSDNNKVNFIPVETFIGSLDRTARDPVSGESIFLDDIVNAKSNYINVFSNVVINPIVETYVVSNQTGTSLGFYDSDCEKKITIDKSIMEALDIAMEKLKNSETIRIDLVVDAGVSTIAQFIGISSADSSGKYDPQFRFTGAFNNLNRNVDMFWRKVIQKYDSFCSNMRGGDCMFICDAPRSFCLIGNQRIVRHSAPKNTIKKDILPNVKYLTGFNTSYGAGYCNWFRCIDDITQDFIWLPPTVKAAGVYFRCNPVWLAPAGLNRGLAYGSYDVAFNPDQNESDFLYVNNWNYALAYPRDGIFIAGQKTFQTNKSAFDRVNVRRLFNEMKRNVKNIARRYLYEQLTWMLITDFKHDVLKYLSTVKLNDGCSEYYVVCDNRNNNTETMENNELHCSIGVKPIKSLEFIVLNFICTNQSANVQEITTAYL